MVLKDKLDTNLSSGNRQDEQAVIICLLFPGGKLRNPNALKALNDLAKLIAEIITTSGLGTLLGYRFYSSIEQDTISLYLYGENARELYNEIKPIIDSLSGVKESYVLKRFSLIESV